MKYSIIVPVYNMELYLNRCLNSILKQTYCNYEVIIVNDGSNDRSQNIIDNFLKHKNFKCFIKENGGLSDARNFGVSKSKGDYLLFLDSDDYINDELLENLNNHLKDNYDDLLRFQIKEIKKDIENEEKGLIFNSLSGREAFKYLINYKYIEPAWAYAYKTSFYNKNKFKFKVNHTHEDFGLIPLIIYKANNISSINYCGYNYCIRANSIITFKSYSWERKKVVDFYNQGLELLNSIDDKLICSYISNCMIEKICKLNNYDYKIFKNKLNENKIFSYVLSNNIKRKIKKTFLRISPKFFYKVVKVNEKS